MSFKKAADRSLNKFGNTMGNLRDAGHELERIPEKAVKATARVATKAPGALAKEAADISVGVLKEMSGIVAYGAREVTGSKKKAGPFKSNLAKGWFE